MVTIACTTQNRRHITAHAGRCRHFLIKHVNAGVISDWEGRSLDKDEVLCGRSDALPPALQGVDVLVTAGAGPGLRARLARFGVQVIITDILLPDQALSAWMAGRLCAESIEPAISVGEGTAAHCASADAGCDCRGGKHSH